MKDKTAQLIAVLILLAIAFYMGFDYGRGKICDAIKPAVLDSSRTRGVITSEFYDGYLREIEGLCGW